MKVSVIVPVYNTEKYLERCMNSLLNQTLDGVEIIAVDDGSTDSSGMILEKLCGQHPDRMKVFHEKNSGQGVARNLAIRHCTGEYVSFLDSDDRADLNKYEVLYREAKKKDADFVACAYRDTTEVNGKEKILNPYVASRPAKEPKDLFFGALVTPILLMYRRTLLLDHDVKFTEGLIYEDTSFYLKAIPYIRKIAIVEQALGSRLRRGGSTMTICKSFKVAQIMPVLQDTIDFYRKNKLMQNYGSELEYFCVRILLCSSMERIARVKNYREGWQLIKDTLDFVNQNFPDFRKNPYFRRGLTNGYMRSFCSFTAGIYYPIFRIKGKLERRYE